MVNKFNNKKIRYVKIINRLLPFFFITEKQKTEIDICNAKEILVIDPAMIGDMVMLEPFFRVLKMNAKKSKITLVCTSMAAPILHNTELIDEYIFVKKEVFDIPRLKKKSKILYKEALECINKKEYDLAIEPRGDIRYLYFMNYCNAKRKVSYNYTGGECFLTDVVIPSQNANHIIEDEFHLLKHIGCKFEDKDKYPRLFLSDEERRDNIKFCKVNNITDNYIIGIHPGASLKIKQWSGFAKLSKKIAENYPDCVFILFEGPEEKIAADNVELEFAGSRTKIIRSKTNIQTYMRLLALCDIVICNDSGAGHIAAAYGSKVISIFGPVLPSLARPFAVEGVYTVSIDTLDCKPCLSSKCKRDNECINFITVDMVYKIFKAKK